MLYKESGVILSPNYPNGYPEDGDCTWQIRLPKGSQIALKFLSFDVCKPPMLLNSTFLYYISFSSKNIIVAVMILLRFLTEISNMANSVAIKFPMKVQTYF